MESLLFKVVTDQLAIGTLLGTKNLTNRFARWVMRLAPYNFEVVYLAGKHSRLADALSRYISKVKELVSYLNSAPLFFTPLVNLKELQDKDAFCGSILKILKKPERPNRVA